MAINKRVAVPMVGSRRFSSARYWMSEFVRAPRDNSAPANGASVHKPDAVRSSDPETSVACSAGLDLRQLALKLLFTLEVKPLVISLLKRNTLVAAAFVFVLMAVRLVPDRYTPQWIFPVIFFCGLLWANSILIKRGRPISAAVLSLLLVPILGVPA